jgi:hypothetical protein
MCTVTYLPTSEGYILGSNRDETPLRASNPLVTDTLREVQIIYPRDTRGGSWLFASAEGVTICVLNGAAIKHQHRPPYKESRGIIAKKYFNYPDPVSYMKNVDLPGIEPFTMIIATRKKLYQFQWDGQIKHVSNLDIKKPYIWSSSTLYTPEMAQLRAEWFIKFISDTTQFTREEADFIHRNGTVGDPTQDYVMNRDNVVRTISISLVLVKRDQISFEFENLVEPGVQYASIDAIRSENISL